MFRKKRLYKTVKDNKGSILVVFKNTVSKNTALAMLDKDLLDLKVLKDEDLTVSFVFADDVLSEYKKQALKQNIITLRNRVNELGVSEPIIQQQGLSRIVVQLPGVQDTSRAKEILGAVATLEFRMVDDKNDANIAAKKGVAPAGSEIYRFRDGRPLLLKKHIITTGNSINNASSGFSQDDNSPMVSLSLDGNGGRAMLKSTKKNIGKRMAVVFIENKVETVYRNGKLVKKRFKTEDIINAATIRGVFSNRFQITGLDSPKEARNLALLLRAGSLSAPIEIIEERTVGPSLGRENINKGVVSIIVGFILVLAFMVFRYRIFGIVSNITLTLNLLMITAILSILQATLTLPGIAGIVLTVGMAVDANVLIFERIREELKAGSDSQKAIQAGYEKALSTITDANITTLIASVVLFSFGTGPIKGFAVTLSIGIITSMFCAIVASRAIINRIYGNKTKQVLSRMKQINFVARKTTAFIFSALIIIVSVISISTQGLKLGIDFTGGIVLEVKYQEQADLEDIRKRLVSAGFNDITAQYFGNNTDVIIRLAPQKISSAKLSSKALNALVAGDVNVEMRRVEYVGPKVGEELTNDGALAIIYALIGILIYVTFRFEYRFSLGAIFALVHDVIITLGFFLLQEWNLI